MGRRAGAARGGGENGIGMRQGNTLLLSDADCHVVKTGMGWMHDGGDCGLDCGSGGVHPLGAIPPDGHAGSA